MQASIEYVRFASLPSSGLIIPSLCLRNTTETRSENRFRILTRATGFPDAQDDILQLTVISIVIYDYEPRGIPSPQLKLRYSVSGLVSVIFLRRSEDIEYYKRVLIGVNDMEG